MREAINQKQVTLKNGYQKTTIRLVNTISGRVLRTVVLISNELGLLTNYHNVSALTIYDYSNQKVTLLDLEDGKLYHKEKSSFRCWDSANQEFSLHQKFYQDKSDKALTLNRALELILNDDMENYFIYTLLMINEDEAKEGFENYLAYPFREGGLPDQLYHQRADEEETKEEQWTQKGKRFYHPLSPSIIFYKIIKGEKKLKSILYTRDYKDGPGIIHYNSSGNVSLEYYYKGNILHRDDGPALIFYDKKGKIKQSQWFLEGKEIKG